MHKDRIAPALLREFGADICQTTGSALEAANADAWRMYDGAAAALLLPRTTADVANIMRWCHRHHVAVVPQGGNTGLAGGATPDASGRQIVLGLARLNRIREVDTANYTMTVDAGCVLADVQQAAAEAGRLFPLSLGAEGSCQIGGVISTNAGGSNTIRYGNTRDLVLGLEVVLADGSIWHGLRKLRKDNTGYSLRNLFIGAEGTLGIVTGAVLKLFPAPTSVSTALVELTSLDAAIRLLDLLRSKIGDDITAFELVSRRLVQLVRRHLPDVSALFPDDRPWSALLEFSATARNDLDDQVGAVLLQAQESGLIHDAILAMNERQRRQMWNLRDGVSEAQLRHGESIYTDVSIPISRIPDFIETASEALRAHDPAVDINAFGHIGDGNIHFNLLQPEGRDADDFLSRKRELLDIIYAAVAEYDGSFSAEHGIGQAKLEDLVHYKSAVEMDMMKALREALAGDAFNPLKTVPSRDDPGD